jgi:iron complex outermembrane receptor protein
VNVVFKGSDLLDPKNYVYVDGFNQSVQHTYSAATEFKGDLRLNTFWNTIDWLKVGYSYTNRTYDRGYGYRGYGGLRIPIDSLPNYKLTEIGQLFPNSPASASANWLIGDSNSIRASFADIRARFSGIFPELVNPYPKDDPYKGFSGSEDVVAAYGMLHYNVKLLFPIEGIVGARAVNSMTVFTAYQFANQRQVVNGVTVPGVATKTRPRGNYLDILPSLNAIIHFTPKLQLRTAYTYDVGRPSAYLMNPALTLNLDNTASAGGNGGNADLKAVSTKKYDASLEWYFGSTGTASLAVWQWDQDGLIANQTRTEYVPELPGVPVQITRPYNLGRGRHRGIEGQFTTFFTFLPGLLKSFGGSVNGTLNITKAAFPNVNAVTKEVTFDYGPYLFVSKFTYNLVGFFERDGLNVRVAYNWRSRQQARRDGVNPYNNLFIDPVERLDASINYDITKSLTVALEASNLTKNGNRSYWGSYDVPQDVRTFSRNYSLSVRTRF